MKNPFKHIEYTSQLINNQRASDIIQWYKDFVQLPTKQQNQYQYEIYPWHAYINQTTNQPEIYSALKEETLRYY